MNSNDIQRSLRLLDYDSYEIRVINSNRPFIPSQLIHSFSDLLPICQQHDAQANIYIGVNERNKINATKEDIDAVNFVIIDLDSERPDKNQPANQQELDATIEASEVIADFFVTQGFQPPIRAMSGNGCHLWARIPQFTLTSLEMTEQWESKVKQLYQQIKSILPDDLKQKVWIDSIQDVTRIIKLIGTTSVKNNPTDDRPNRVSSWLDDPESIVEDPKLFDYLQSLAVDFSLLQPKSIFVSAPVIDGDLSDLDDLDLTQLTTLERARDSYHVKNVRHLLKNDNRSISDYAFLKELAREGILDTQVWKYALITTPGTKFDRDRDLAYVETTVNNLWQEVSSTGIFLDQAQKQLAQEFDHININGQQIIVCEAKVGTGKTFNAVRKVQQAVEQDISVIVLVPTHALANEWEKRLDLVSPKSVVRLYGISHPEVGCPHNTKQNISLMKTGHSTLFRQKYCASCPLQENCKHLQSVNLAPESDVLVAQHRHLNLFPGFLQTQHGNRDRTLVVIDEMPELVNVEKISANDIQQNIQLFQQLVETESNPDLENVIEVLSQLKEAHHHRQNIQLSHEAINKLHHVDFEHLNQMIVNHYTNNNQQPNGRNLLWDLFNLGILKAKLEYVKDPGSKDERDVLIYRWTPNFNHKTALILSGTVKSEYIERQINQSVRPMAENWSIIRKNLKVVQLIASASGRSRLQAKIQSGKFHHQHGMLFGLMLAKHKGQSIAIITSLGDNGVFKLAVKEALQPIADQHNVKLTTINKLSQQAIPEGVEEIPIFHWKIEGLDVLKGKFEVIWEMNGHYYPEDQIKTAVREKFGIDCSQVKPTFSYLPTTDFFNQQNYQTKSLVWKHPLAKMEVDHNQVADMIQTEGRFLREDEIHKTIYRTHNVIFQPYPTRIYQSWKILLEQEFEDYISPLELLKPKEKKIHDWIQDNYNGLEFTVNEISSDMDLDQDNMRNKYLKRLVELYLLEKRKVNRKNLYRLIM